MKEFLIIWAMVFLLWEQKMTKVEIVEFVKEKLLNQYECSFNENECAYRGENGLKCAIGHLIPDDLYLPQFEGTGIHSISPIKNSPTGEKLKTAIEKTIGRTLNADDLMVLATLQKIHDDYDVDNWEEAFDQLIEDINEGGYDC